MASINLLPWREERRQALKKEFLTVLGVVVAVAVLLVVVANRVVNGAIEHQQARNQYLQTHINELNRQVKEIAEIEKKRAELIDRMKVIQDLQGTRPLIVRVFDELVRTLPDGVFFRSLNRTGNQIELQGVAESNTRVSSLMRQLEASEWFESPNLTAVEAAPDFGELASSFRMTVRISAPQEEKGTAASNAGSRAGQKGAK
jgi:type IV pilus assembly protein PilN